MQSQDNSGKLHPLTTVAHDVAKIFFDMGYETARGHEIETQYNNFDSLNIPADHPARDMHDTFFLHDDPDKVMRTHISSHQVPYLQKNKDRLADGPLKMFSVGRVFRFEATDATHEVQFMYMEGLVVGEHIHLGHLKGTLRHFLKKLMNDDALEMRLRPGYFPFVEPGLEVDLKIGDTWQEVLGSGMIHPKVLENAGIDSEKYSGFAFGVGIDRLMMARYNVPDVRLSYAGDLRLHYGIHK